MSMNFEELSSVLYITATCSLSLVNDCVDEDTDVSICILCDKMFEDDGFEVCK